MRCTVFKCEKDYTGTPIKKIINVYCRPAGWPCLRINNQKEQLFWAIYLKFGAMFLGELANRLLLCP